MGILRYGDWIAEDFLFLAASFRLREGSDRRSGRPQRSEGLEPPDADRGGRVFNKQPGSGARQRRKRPGAVRSTPYGAIATGHLHITLIMRRSGQLACAADRGTRERCTG